MLARNRDTGGISDQHFSDLAELAQLVENDLAVLLSERFEMASLMQAPRTTRRWPGLFQCRPRRCGHERRVAAVEDLVFGRACGW
jgi:hypothetical protein